jgi:hypothetical protein
VGLEAPVAPDAESPAPDELIDALCLCLSDIETVAYSTSQTMRALDPAGTVASGIDEARLKGLGDHVQELRLWVIGDRNPFIGTGIDNALLLVRLNILHATARKIIEAPGSYSAAGYLSESAEIIGLIREQRSVTNIVFFLRMLGEALGPLAGALKGIAPDTPPATQPGPPRRPGKIRVFLAASKPARSAAELLAVVLPKTSLGPEVTQSWLRLPELSTQTIIGVQQAIKECQYGVLVLTPEESTVPLDAADAAAHGTLHLRLSADAEFMLGFMAGAFGVTHTFMVVPADKKDQAELTGLLAGITFATYDPGQLENASDGTMENACTLIVRTIVSRERDE